MKQKFPRIAFFLAWDDEFSPIKHQNAAAFFNNARLVNLNQVDSLGRVIIAAEKRKEPSGIVLQDFSLGVGQWKGAGMAGGPYRTNDVMFGSAQSVKSGLELSTTKYPTLYSRDKSTFRLSGRTRMIAHVGLAPWGLPNGGSVSAKLYVLAGSSWTWYDSGVVVLKSGTLSAITFDLTRLSANQLNDVQEIGVQFISNVDGGQTTVYLSYITAE